MSDKQPLGELLLQAITDIEEIGGPERHQLVQVIGRNAYDAMMSKRRTADLIDRWIDAGSKAKPAATKALAVAIAKVANKPELVSRIEREVSDAFEPDGPESTKRAQTATETKNHAAAVNQRRNGQRSGYQAPRQVQSPKGVSVSRLADLARSPDASKYILARRKSARGARP